MEFDKYLVAYNKPEGLNYQELSRELKITERQAKKIQRSLKRLNLLEKIGARNKSGVYRTVSGAVKQQVSKEQETVVDAGEYTFSVTTIKPPTEKPLHYDVDSNLPLLCRMIDNQPSMTVLFKGEPGTGKTNLITYLQWKYQKEIIRINVTVNTEAQELKGKYVICDDGRGNIVTKWMDGLVTSALRQNAWLQIEEVNFMRREHQSIFYSLLDQRHEIILEQRAGERVTNEKLVTFLTMNPLAILKPLIPALKSRIDLEFEFSHLTRKRQAMVLTKKYDFPQERALQIATILVLLRKKYEKLPLSSREAEAWVKALKTKNSWIQDKVQVLKAFNHAVAMKVTEDQIVRAGLISVAEAIIEGKVGYEEIEKELGESKEDGGTDVDGN